MKTPRLHSQSAVALVIVLAMLVLLSGLVIGYMTFATTERKASREAQSQFDARTANESAVNLVISQLRDATKQEGANEKAVAWASQPGAVRTWGSDAASARVYKLYSSETMQQPEADYHPENEVPTAALTTGKIPTGWVDLNEPIVRLASNSTPDKPTYEATFPIVDPYVKYPYIPGTPQTNGENSGYFDSSKAWTVANSSVKGFFCKDLKDPNSRNDSKGNTLRVLPLPVRWVYILRDGSYATVKIDGKINGATKDNPVVSRIAFWTDDDCSKLNINTAAEGRFWDTPMVAMKNESGDIASDQSTIPPPGESWNLSVSQPAQAEYQRYPGHPATTCLSPAIRWLFPDYTKNISGTIPYNYLSQPIPDADWGFREAIYRLAPRITNGKATTYGGSRPVLNTATDSIVLDHQHLYATLDEYFFKPDRTGRDVAPRLTPTLIEGEVAIPYFNPAAVDRLRFFLTPSSRAPELNLFGLPRMTVWPLYSDIKRRTPFDETTAFASTIKGRQFFFQRSQPLSATNDYDNIPRNQQLYSYLQAMTDKNIPWLGKNLATKYGADKKNRDQILTEILDYIRCANLVDTTATTGGTTYAATFTPFLWPDRTKPEQQMPVLNSGQVIPLRITKDGNTTQGFGRFVTPAEVAILFYGVNTQANGQPIPAGKKGVRAVLLVDMFTVAPGYAGLRENYGMRIQQVNDTKFKLSTSIAADGVVDMNFPVDSFNIVNVDAYSAPIGRVFMPFRGFQNQFAYDKTEGGLNRPWTTFPKTFPATGREKNKVREVYPFVSDVMVIANNATDMTFTTANLQIDTYAPDVADPYTGTPTSVQTIHINFQGTKVPVPAFIQDFAARLTIGTNTNRTNLDPASASSGYQWIKNGDVIRSMELSGPTKGDQRLAAARADVPAIYWDKRQSSTVKYDSMAQRVHGLRESRGGYMPGGSTQDVPDGNLVGIPQTYRSERGPKLPNNINGVTMDNGQPGDWDRGMSKNVDGAFINKTDEGTMNFDFGAGGGLRLPYWLGYSGYEELRPIHFTPNRIMPGAVMFGSLPTAVYSDKPWQTLLFHPAVKTGGGKGAHPGADDPADHYLLDLFTMPVVEPYAISEPFSTAGKVNINYLAAPFSYWTVGGAGNAAVDSYMVRRTAVQGLLRSTKIMLLPKNLTEAGHHESPLDDATNKSRYPIDEEKTLDEMHTRLRNGLFRSASEICEINLHPTGFTSNADLWADRPLSGDNGRERPYAHIYPRVTTKSNVYTVHVRAEAVLKSPAVDPDVWDDSKDQVVGVYRGSTTIERFLDPNDKALIGFDETKSGPLDPYYRYRIVQSRQY